MVIYVYMIISRLEQIVKAHLPINHDLNNLNLYLKVKKVQRNH